MTVIVREVKKIGGKADVERKRDGQINYRPVDSDV
jgi:hypothetical protein